jgi:hypothetical protein
MVRNMTQLSNSFPLMAEERIQLQIKISQEADAKIEAIRKKIGMSKVEILSRLCRWFSEQGPTVQRLIADTLGEEMTPVARNYLLQQLATPSPVEEGGAAGLQETAEQNLADVKPTHVTKPPRRRRKAGEQGKPA